MNLQAHEQDVQATKDGRPALGEGAVAKVWSGKLDDKIVVIKESKNVKDNSLLIDEAKTLRSLGNSHPHLVSILGTSPSISAAAAQANKAFQIVLSPLCNRNLFKWATTSEGRLPLEAIRVVAVKILRAAQFLVEREIVHLDFDTSNWMLKGQPGSKEEFLPMLGDFNASSKVAEAGTNLVGHINFMSTDILYGGKKIAKADIQVTGLLVLFLIRKKAFGVGDGDGEEDFGDFDTGFPGGEDPTNRNLMKKSLSRLMGSPSKKVLEEIDAVYRTVSCCYKDASTSVRTLLEEEFEENEQEIVKEFEEIIESLLPYSPSQRKHPWLVIQKLLRNLPKKANGLSALTDVEKRVVGEKFDREEEKEILEHF